MASLGTPPNPFPAPAIDEVLPTRWGLGDALVGWVLAYLTSAVFSAIVLSAMGWEPGEELTLGMIAISYPPLWLGFVGVPVWAAATKGNGWVTDFGGRIKGIDVPVGIAAGLAAQLILVPLVSLPILWLSGTDTEDLTKPAQDLADKAVGSGGAILFFIIVGVCAPVAEELFFRGLVMRSFDKRWGRRWALALSSLCFGLTHLQPLQLAGLVAAGAVFGYLAQRTGRLGPAVVAHMTFNITAVVALLWLK